MQVTDEMVEAAQDAVEHVRYGLMDSEMRVALSAALSALVEEKPVKVKALEWMQEGRKLYAGTPFSRSFYEIRPFPASHDKWKYKLDIYGSGTSPLWDNVEDAKAAAQSDYEARIRAALVDVPAVEPETVAWQPKYKQNVIDHHRSIGSDLWEYAMTVFRSKEDAESYGLGAHEVRPLYASPVRSTIAPAPAEVEAIVAAAQRYVDSVNGEPEKDCWDTEDGKEAPGAERIASDWAWKAYDEAKQQAFDNLRAALSPSLVHAEDGMAHGSATSTKGCAE